MVKQNGIYIPWNTSQTTDRPNNLDESPENYTEWNKANPKRLHTIQFHTSITCLKWQNLARRGGSRLWSQHFGRPRRVDHEVKRSRSSWSTRWNPVSTKNTKMSWAWWRVPVIPATQEAEAGELPEPRRQRLWWAEIASLGKQEWNSLSKTKIKNK